MPANLDPFLPFPSAVKRVIEKITLEGHAFLLLQDWSSPPPTQIGADAMRDLGPFSIAHVMPVSNGMEISDYELAEGADAGKVPGELRIAFVGRLAEEKNVDGLIEALSRCRIPQSTWCWISPVAASCVKLSNRRRTIAACPTA